MEWKEYAHQKWMDQKKPLTTNNEKAYGKNYGVGDDAKKGNNTTPKESAKYGSAQQAAMKPKDVACKYK